MNPKRLEKIKYEFGIRVKKVRLSQNLTQLDHNGGLSGDKATVRVVQIKEKGLVPM